MIIPLAETYALRTATVDDARRLAEAYARNRDHLAPWEPVREDEFFTVAGQAERLAARVRSDAAGTSITLLIVTDSGDVVGSVNVNDIVLGAFHNGNLGYWLDAAHTGRGLMTRAVESVCALVAERGLHRLQAATLLDNAASQEVLRRTGFTEIGIAEAYLRIAGAWQDHRLFQRIVGDPSR